MNAKKKKGSTPPEQIAAPEKNNQDWDSQWDPEMILVANNIYSLYKGKEGAANVVALRGLNLNLKKGELVSIVGPSGAGKSTLLRILGGLQEPYPGIQDCLGQTTHVGRWISPHQTSCVPKLIPSPAFDANNIKFDAQIQFVVEHPR